MDFQGWPKIARLNRDIVVTEKIDGTNAAILIEPTPYMTKGDEAVAIVRVGGHGSDGEVVQVGAQSRKRLITPGSDNFGFAQWVFDHAQELVDTLGVGRHFGEWWGSGIQRGYDQPKGLRHFSLFNTDRYRGLEVDFEGSILAPVPVLYHGPFSEQAIYDAQIELRVHGSHAAVGFRNPEGIIVFHSAAQAMFKVTLEGDEKPKGAVA